MGMELLVSAQVGGTLPATIASSLSADALCETFAAATTTRS